MAPKRSNLVLVYQSSRKEGVFGDNKGSFLLNLHKKVCCEPLSEPSRWDGADEGSQYMVSMRNKKNYHPILPLI